ncbi:MAG: hypothetical protein KKA16_02035 [Alphaproteobacteria bacterium]|nr:hypothetical protein [Alphaproteobacteria bacterium]MBU2377891.1 hypothetical protein [Alphaproteobacteria bacterium]
MRACVVGNCQADGIADWLRLFLPDAEVEAFSIAGVDADSAEERAIWRAMLDRSDLVVTQIGQVHQARYGIPSPEALRSEGRRVLLAPWITFRGFHPDCVFLFDRGAIVHGAAGPHHSAMAVAACLEGLTETRALGLFNGFSYSALGYFDAFATAAEVMTDQWSQAGLDAAAWLTSRPTPFMSTINHPVVDVLGDVARQVLRRADIDMVEPSQRPIDRLLAAGAWPIYPGLAARLGVPSSTAFAYPDRQVSLEDLVAGTYAALSDLTARGLAADVGGGHPASKPVIDRARAFIRDHVRR